MVESAFANESSDSMNHKNEVVNRIISGIGTFFSYGVQKKVTFILLR